MTGVGEVEGGSYRRKEKMAQDGLLRGIKRRKIAGWRSDDMSERMKGWWWWKVTKGVVG